MAAFRTGLLLLYVASAAVYFPWRLTVFNPAAPIFSTFFFAIEVIGFVWGIIFLVSVLKISQRKSPPAPAELAVDVFIPTYNEPVDILRRTLVAALRISYPHETWLLDDGNRPEMRALAEELGCRYIARKDNSHAKAGNLNNAMRHATGEFIALFDADFIADPSFLDSTLGYFTNPKVAFVQTPQEYYNYDSFQHVGRGRSRDPWSEHSLFYRVIQPGRDRFNASMFCGCSAVLRRKAIDSVGGIATGTVTEDMHTSVRLHDSGWESVFHAETLSCGLATHDAHSFRRQRLRWAQGAMQVFRRERLFFGSKGLSPAQRLAYILHVIAHMEGLRHTFIYLIPIVTLFFSLSPFDIGFRTWAMFSVPYIALGIVSFEEFSRGHGRLLKNETFNLARCPSSMQSLAALIDQRHIPFWVTPKIKSKGGFIFPWVVLLATTLALGKIAWQAATGHLSITGWPLVVLTLWALLSASFAIQVCLLTQRCRDNRRDFSRFPVEIPVLLNPVQAPIEKYAATVTEVSDRGLTLRSEPGVSLPDGHYAGKICLRGVEVPFNISLRAYGQGKGSGGALAWDDTAARDDYQYLILIERIRWLAQFDKPDQKTARTFFLKKNEPVSVAS